MAIQGFTTGAQGLLLMAPVQISSTGVATLVPAVTGSAFPDQVSDLYDSSGNLITSKYLELCMFSSKTDEVGIVSTSPNFAVAPKTFTVTMDRDDI